MHTSTNLQDYNTNMIEKDINQMSIKDVLIREAESHVHTIPTTIRSLFKQFTNIEDYDAFSIIDAYYDKNPIERLVRHQIESYNYFTNVQIEKTIQMFNPVIMRSENDYVADKKQYFLEIQVTFENFKMFLPQIYENNGATKIMYPNEARTRSFTYSSYMNIDLHILYIIRDTENMDCPRYIKKVLPSICIGKMPIMLKSDCCVLKSQPSIIDGQFGECPIDLGGYFIVKGSEKTVLGQERSAENKIYCFEDSGKYSWRAELKSVPDNKSISPKQVNVLVSSKSNGFGYGIFVEIPRMKNPVEIFVLFRALHVLSDKSICEYILLDLADEQKHELLAFLQASIIDGNKYMTHEDAMRHLTSNVAYTVMNLDKEQGAKKKREFMNEVLQNDLFPHCKTVVQKLYLLGYMVKRIIETAKKWTPLDDRDAYTNKRIELTGTLMNNLFRNYFNRLVKDMQKVVVREINQRKLCITDDYENIINITNIYKIIKSTTIENGIARALSTGDFSIKQSNSSKVGVGQVLNRLNFHAAISHLRRVNTPLEKSNDVLIEPRKLHGTTWGFLCPTETPEGGSIGIVKNIALLTHITIPSNSQPLYDIILPKIVEFRDDLPPSYYNRKVKVFINGTWVGVSLSPMELYSDLKEKKCSGIISIYTSIIFSFVTMELRVCNDGGRMMRPVLRIKNGQVLVTPTITENIKNKKLSWNDLLVGQDSAILEYIDPEEQNVSMISILQPNQHTQYDSSVTYHYTHSEIHPCTIYGALASCTTFSESNPATRNTYQCAMIKQAMGIYNTQFQNRMDKTAYVLAYPSRPIVETRIMSSLGLERVAAGNLLIVAIGSYTGYNQEDSLLLNQGAIDRGMLATTVYHTEKDEDKNATRDEIIRCKPNPRNTKGVKLGNYDKLNDNGFIPENTLLENRDIIISKIQPIRENKNDPMKIIKYEDQSKMYRTTEECYVDKNYTGRNGDGYTMAKVRIRTFRKPVLGDKFSSKYGQKGTTGLILPECDMPFTKNGVRPDIILNPHAIPSRMTIGQLKETLMGKVLLQLGWFGDGTAFNSMNIHDIIQKLPDMGYESYGNEIMYSGITGKQFESSIFLGPCYYQRLKHMVNDKQHSRAFGPMVNLTRQPAEGRSRDGGFRIGEMERDVMIAHGMSRFCVERLLVASDNYSAHTCSRCGMIASYYDGENPFLNEKNNGFTVHKCKSCENTTDFAKVQIPYSFKLLAQELQTINVVPRIITE